jgi:hypothetical protein
LVASRPSRRIEPVLALWVSERGWRAPVEARPAIGQPMPLGLLPVSVRALTLVAIRDLFGEEMMTLEAAARRASASSPRRDPPAAGALAARGAALARRLPLSGA